MTITMFKSLTYDTMLYQAAQNYSCILETQTLQSLNKIDKL